MTLARTATSSLIFLSTLLVLSEASAQTTPSSPSSRPGDSSFQAGGLAPPPPIASGTNNSGASSTEKHLQNSEKEDSGRSLEWFWLNAEAGYETLGLTTLKASDLTYGAVSSSSSGLVYGGGLGIRLLFFTLGARARLGNFSQFKLGTVDAEAGLHFPLGNVEPYLTLAGGYAFMTSFDAARWGTSDVSIRGLDVRAGFGVDYYVTPTFTLGGNLTGEMLALTRSSIGVDKLKASSTQGSLDATAAGKAQLGGSGIGAAATLSAVAGLHF